MMDKIPYVDYINKIMLLEKKVGIQTSYKMLESFQVNTNNIIDVQHAAGRIGKFIGLKSINFVVSFTRQEPNTAGHIELNSDEKETQIFLNYKERKSSNALLTTLSHEISHKYLYDKNIRCNDTKVYVKENEVLTDITAVFLGLGKLMLNGCKTINVSEELKGNGGKVITNTTRGYLSLAQLAFVYLLICSMRNISEIDYEHGLSNNALQHVKQCKQNYRNYFNSSYHINDIKNSMYDRFKKSLTESQEFLADIAKYHREINRLLMSYTDSYLTKSHRKLKILDFNIKSSLATKDFDPCIKYLDALQYNFKIKKCSDILESNVVNEFKLLALLSKIHMSIVTTKFKNQSETSNDYMLIKCYNDGTILRIPLSNQLIKVTCKTCKYTFIEDTRDIIVAELQVDE